MIYQWLSAVCNRRDLHPKIAHSDKDMAKIDALKKCWPEVSHSLCFWHAKSQFFSYLYTIIRGSLLMLNVSIEAVGERLVQNSLNISLYHPESVRQLFPPPFISTGFVPPAQLHALSTSNHPEPCSVSSQLCASAATMLSTKIVSASSTLVVRLTSGTLRASNQDAENQPEDSLAGTWGKEGKPICEVTNSEANEHVAGLRLNFGWSLCLSHHIKSSVLRSNFYIYIY